MNNAKIISFFWNHIKPYKRYYFFIMGVSVISSFYPFFYHFVIKFFLNLMEANRNNTFEDFLLPILAFLALQLIMDVLYRISDIADWRSDPFVKRSIILKCYNDIQYQSLVYFQNFLSGTIGSKIKSLLDAYDDLWFEMHSGICFRAMKTLINIIALSFININLGIFVLFWGILYFLCICKFSKKLKIFSFYTTESIHQIIGLILDKITNIASLVAFSSRQREYDALDIQIKENFISKKVKENIYSFKVQLAGNFFYFIMFSFVIWYMIFLKIENKISLGDFAFVFGLVLVVTEDVFEFTSALPVFFSTIGTLKSALSILSVTIIENQKKPLVSKTLVLETSPSIYFNNVTFAYKQEIPVLENFNLFISPGEKVGFVGRSGAGKTTLINLLLGYYLDYTGEILINYENLKNYSPESIIENISLIPQEVILFHRSYLENILYGNPNATETEIIKVSKMVNLHEDIIKSEHGYHTNLGERGLKISGGQRQRIAIARAILKNAPILILDEATSALDSQTERDIQQAWNILISNKHKTVLAIAHRLSTLKNMDRIIVLEKGKILEEGTHHSLMKQENSFYKKLWEMEGVE